MGLSMLLIFIRKNIGAKKTAEIIIRYWFPPIGFAGLIFLLSLQPELRSPFPSLIDLILRKIGHMGEYFILTVLLARVGLRGSRGIWERCLTVLIAGSGAFLTAIFDENIQTFVPGREGCLRDILIDGVGIALAILVIFLYLSSKLRPLK